MKSRVDRELSLGVLNRLQKTRNEKRLVRPNNFGPDVQVHGLKLKPLHPWSMQPLIISPHLLNLTIYGYEFRDQSLSIAGISPFANVFLSRALRPMLKL